MSAPSSGDASQALADLQLLDISQISANLGNPRLDFPQDELDRLSDSIDQEGVLVRKLGITGVPAIVSQEGSRLRIDEVVAR